MVHPSTTVEGCEPKRAGFTGYAAVTAPSRPVTAIAVGTQHDGPCWSFGRAGGHPWAHRVSRLAYPESHRSQSGQRQGDTDDTRGLLQVEAAQRAAHHGRNPWLQNPACSLLVKGRRNSSANVNVDLALRACLYRTGPEHHRGRCREDIARQGRHAGPGGGALRLGVGDEVGPV